MVRETWTAGFAALRCTRVALALTSAAGVRILGALHSAGIVRRLHGIALRSRRLLAATLALLCQVAFAQVEPGRPLRMVVPYPPGGSSDIQARLVAQGLAERLGQPVIVENRPGASAVIGTEHVARQPPDGTTMLLAAPPFVITPHTEQKLPYDVKKEFAGVSLLSRAPMLVAVPRDSPVKGFPDLVNLARAQPGRLAYGSVGAGGLGATWRPNCLRSASSSSYCTCRTRDRRRRWSTLPVAAWR